MAHIGSNVEKNISYILSKNKGKKRKEWQMNKS